MELYFLQNLDNIQELSLKEHFNDAKIDKETNNYSVQVLSNQNSLRLWKYWRVVQSSSSSSLLIKKTIIINETISTYNGRMFHYFSYSSLFYSSGNFIYLEVKYTNGDENVNFWKTQLYKFDENLNQLGTNTVKITEGIRWDKGNKVKMAQSTF